MVFAEIAIRWAEFALISMGSILFLANGLIYAQRARKRIGRGLVGQSFSAPIRKSMKVRILTGVDWPL